MFRRNLFKFVALNSFKIVCVVSIVLFACVIANAQILQTGKDKAVVQCIQNLKVERTPEQELKLSFRTKESVKAVVRVQKWGSERPEEKPDWLEVGSGHYDPSMQPAAYHIFKIGLSKVDGKIPGGKYRLVLTAGVFKLVEVSWGRVDFVFDHSYECEKEFTTFYKGNPLNNLRLRPKPKQ